MGRVELLGFRLVESGLQLVDLTLQERDLLTEEPGLFPAC